MLLAINKTKNTISILLYLKPTHTRNDIKMALGKLQLLELAKPDRFTRSETDVKSVSLSLSATLTCTSQTG